MLLRSSKPAFAGCAFWGLFALAAIVLGTPAHAMRVTGGLVAFYDFEEGSGTQILDHSEGTALDLTIRDPGAVSWGAGFLSFNTGGGNTIADSSVAATKIINAVVSSSALTIEAWVRPDNTTQGGPSRIFTLSTDILNRNFTLGQVATGFDQRVRTTSTNLNGIPSLATPTGVATTGLHHLVYTRDASGLETFYVDGVVESTQTTTGDFSNWDAGYLLAIGNEFSLDRTWSGDYHMIATYSRALSASIVADHFAAGASAPIPEPGTGALLGLGLAAVAILRRR